MRAIVETFRARGYAATSLDDLSMATGLSRPSLYAAYGDKLHMYLSAIDAFSAAAQQAIDALVRGTTVEASLRDFYWAMLDIYYGAESGASGCLVYSTAPSTTYEDQVRRRLADSIEELDRTILRRLRELGDGAESEVIRTASEAAANTLIGLSVRVRSGASKRSLRAHARRSAHLLGRLFERRVRRGSCV